MSTGQSVVFNPFVPSFRTNPYPQYERMRSDAPMHRSDALNAWVVTSYEGCDLVLRDPESFSSDARYATGAIADEVAREAEANPLGYVRNVLTSDPPDHTRLRSIVNRAFTPRRIGTMDEHIRSISEALTDELFPDTEFDLMSSLAQPLPVIVIAEMLGIPPSERERFKEWSTIVATATELVPDPEELVRRRDATEEMVEFLGSIVDKRAESPEDDLISAIVSDEDPDGDKLTRDEVISFAILLLVAGNETTTNLIGNGMLALLNYRDSLNALVADKSLIPAAMEETLRYDSPVQGLVRVVKQDVELLGQSLPAGDVVMCMLGAANRDPARYTDPEIFDIQREETRHLSFGHGIHFCLGAPLARLEANIAYDSLLTRFSGFSPVKGGLERGGTLLLRGADKLIITASR
jgi:cytochrome P450